MGVTTRRQAAKAREESSKWSSRAGFLLFFAAPLLIASTASSVQEAFDETKLQSLNAAAVRTALCDPNAIATMAVLSVPYWLYWYVWTHAKSWIAFSKRIGCKSAVSAFGNAAHILKVVQLAALVAYLSANMEGAESIASRAWNRLASSSPLALAFGANLCV